MKMKLDRVSFQTWHCHTFAQDYYSLEDSYGLLCCLLAAASCICSENESLCRGCWAGVENCGGPGSCDGSGVDANESILLVCWGRSIRNNEKTSRKRNISHIKIDFWIMLLKRNTTETATSYINDTKMKQLFQCATHLSLKLFLLNLDLLDMQWISYPTFVNVEIFAVTIVCGLDFCGDKFSLDKFLWVRIAHCDYYVAKFSSVQTFVGVACP